MVVLGWFGWFVLGFRDREREKAKTCRLMLVTNIAYLPQVSDTEHGSSCNRPMHPYVMLKINKVEFIWVTLVVFRSSSTAWISSVWLVICCLVLSHQIN